DLLKGSAVHENSGTIQIDAGKTLNLPGSDQTFRQLAGTLKIDGGFTLSSGTFSFEGGEIEGTPYLAASELVLGENATGPASFIQADDGSILRGDIKEGQSVWVRGSAATGNTTLHAPEGLSNYGTLRIESVNSGYLSAFS